jgi:putative ABC transport system permease protein
MRPSSLNRKLLRDLWHLRGQMAAIILVVVCGVATVVTSRVGYESLELSRATYYAEYRFGDVFASLKRAPERIAGAIAAIPGVAEVRTRLVFQVTLDVPGLDEPALGRIVSIPEHPAPILNGVHIAAGRYPAPGRRNEVLVNEAFATANQLQVGDTIGAVLNGRWAELRIVGFALSPEFVYAIPSGGLFPDDRRFGILWMSREAMGPAFDMDGAFNDVVLDLDSVASEPAILARLDRILEPYGGLRAYGRSDHVSDRFLSDEIRQNREFGMILPMLFLVVAAFLLNVLLSRLIAMQRDQIGVLKAFGYTSLAVARHYMGFALIGVLVGGTLGTGVGLWLGSLVNKAYVTLYHFPLLRYEVNASVILFAVGVTLVAALAGGLGAMRRAWRVPPAEAMRPEPPAQFRSGLLERLGLRTLISPPARMIVRNLARRPARAALSTLGIAFAVAILILGRYFIDAIEHLAYVQFRVVQQDDVTVVAHEPLRAAARHALARLPGVIRAEDFRLVPVELRSGHYSRKTSLIGIDDGVQLRRLINRDLDDVALPPEGVLLTTKLAELLAVGPGDPLVVEVLEGARPTRVVRVAGTVDELIGLSAYMSRDALGALLREDATVSGAWLQIDAGREADLYRTLKELPAIGGVSIRQAGLDSFEETLAKSMRIFTSIIVIFSCILAFAVVYNAARIALSERGRELASLRVLGFTRAEITAMLLGEQALLTALAIPLGFGLGYWVCALLSRSYQWELFRLPLIISEETYVFALVTVLVAAIASGLIVRRRLEHLDLVAVLKTRE